MQLPEALQTVEVEAFEGMDSLSAVKVPDGALCIDARAFKNCWSLRVIYVPASVEIIADDAFEGCANVRIYCPADSAAARFAVERGIACQLID